MAVNHQMLERMDNGKCVTHGDIEINFDDSQRTETKVVDKSINIKWKAKTKVIQKMILQLIRYQTFAYFRIWSG